MATNEALAKLGNATNYGWYGLLMAGLTTVVCCGGCQWSASGYNVDGVRLYQQGSSQAAVQKFQQALTADPKNADAYYNLAASYHYYALTPRNDQTMAQAEDLYHQCLDLDPNHAECYRGLASLLVQTNRTASAFRLMEGWAARSPQSPDARIELARLNEEFGKLDLAQRHLTEALDIDAKNVRAWTALGRLREQRGEYAQALSNYRQAYNLNTMNPAVADRIARLQRDMASGVRTDQPGSNRWAAPTMTPTQR